VILDVAIGMAFLYLLLSLIASVVQEILAAFMQLRPAFMMVRSTVKPSEKSQSETPKGLRRVDCAAATSNRYERWIETTFGAGPVAGAGGEYARAGFAELN
jgi:hypothetical protein